MAEATSTPVASGSSGDANPIVSAIVSLVVPGLGQIIQGQTQRGAIILGSAVVLGGMLTAFSIVTLGIGALLFFFWPLVHIAAAADAYLQAGKINAGEVTV